MAHKTSGSAIEKDSEQAKFRAARVVGTVLFTVLIAVLLKANLDIQRKLALPRDGVSTAATIAQPKAHEPGKASDRTMISYSYHTADGNLVTLSEDVPRYVAESLPTGDGVIAYYDKEQPSRAVLQPLLPYERELMETGFVGIIAFAVLVVVLNPCLWSWRRRRNE
ncbi:MAG: DUF3592 domain-containing protein [Chthoniobacter sp.]